MPSTVGSHEASTQENTRDSLQESSDVRLPYGARQQVLTLSLSHLSLHLHFDLEQEYETFVLQRCSTSTRSSRVSALTQTWWLWATPDWSCLGLRKVGDSSANARGTCRQRISSLKMMVFSTYAAAVLKQCRDCVFFSCFDLIRVWFCDDNWWSNHLLGKISSCISCKIVKMITLH